MVPCRLTLLYKHSYVENSTAVISFIHYKDRDKFPFYPNNAPKNIESDEKYHICGIDLQRLFIQHFYPYICKNRRIIYIG